MPISIALPAPSVQFFSDFVYPTAFLLQQVTTAVPIEDDFARTRPRTGQPDVTVAPVSQTASGGVIGPRTEVVGGRNCARISSTVGVASAGFRPDTWSPAWDAADFNAGALLNPPSVVAIWDLHVAAFQTAFVAGTDDETGFGFQPFIIVQPSLAAGTPGGLAPVGGFGVFLNDDGGGNNQWEFVSYDAVPAILQRTVIGAAIIPDVTLWSSFRFTIVSAAAGRPAELSLEVNRTSIVGVQGIPFDDVVLMRPNTLDTNALGFLFAQTLGAMGGAGYRFAMYARFGRFNAAGEELQGA